MLEKPVVIHVIWVIKHATQNEIAKLSFTDLFPFHSNLERNYDEKHLQQKSSLSKESLDILMC